MDPSNIEANVQKLSDVVSYQDGAIVSKTLIKEKNGSVTIFAFDTGQELSEHTAPFDALVLVLNGEAQIIISGQAHHLTEGEAILMPANRPHAVKAEHRFKMMLAMVKK